jgi:hypothetical protein|tara:strand:- start:4273 stop:6297 length:2025 start_codon:yes stop_codon:yes gene_type:complete
MSFASGAAHPYGQPLTLQEQAELRALYLGLLTDIDKKKLDIRYLQDKIKGDYIDRQMQRDLALLNAKTQLQARIIELRTAGKMNAQQGVQLIQLLDSHYADLSAQRPAGGGYYDKEAMNKVSNSLDELSIRQTHSILQTDDFRKNVITALGQDVAAARALTTETFKKGILPNNVENTIKNAIINDNYGANVAAIVDDALRNIDKSGGDALAIHDIASQTKNLLRTHLEHTASGLVYNLAMEDQFKDLPETVDIGALADAIYNKSVPQKDVIQSYIDSNQSAAYAQQAYAIQETDKVKDKAFAMMADSGMSPSEAKEMLEPLETYSDLISGDPSDLLKGFEPFEELTISDTEARINDALDKIDQGPDNLSKSVSRTMDIPGMKRLSAAMGMTNPVIAAIYLTKPKRERQTSLALEIVNSYPEADINELRTRIRDANLDDFYTNRIERITGIRVPATRRIEKRMGELRAAEGEAREERDIAEKEARAAEGTSWRSGGATYGYNPNLDKFGFQDEAGRWYEAKDPEFIETIKASFPSGGIQPWLTEEQQLAVAEARMPEPPDPPPEPTVEPGAPEEPPGSLLGSLFKGAKKGAKDWREAREEEKGEDVTTEPEVEGVPDETPPTTRKEKRTERKLTRVEEKQQKLLARRAGYVNWRRLHRAEEKQQKLRAKQEEMAG